MILSLQLLHHMNLSWPRANAYRDLLSFYLLVHGRSQPQPLSGDLADWARGHVKVSQLSVVLQHLMPCLSAPCCSACSWTTCSLAQASWPAHQSTYQPSGSGVRETAGARHKVKAQKHRILRDRAHVQVPPSIPEP